MPARQGAEPKRSFLLSPRVPRFRILSHATEVDGWWRFRMLVRETMSLGGRTHSDGMAVTAISLDPLKAAKYVGCFSRSSRSPRA